MKRLLIYFFYDKDGIVDDYVPYFLSSIRPYCSEICVVVNEFLTPDGKKKLEAHSDKLLIRKNKGLDAEAYKQAILDYGYEKLKEFDDLLLANFTIFGPVYDFNEMFEKMDNADCDWWGVYKSPQPSPIKYDHIPSFFVNYKKNIFHSEDFKNYWETLEDINTYSDSVTFHEQRQTPYYDNLGYKNATFLDYTKYKNDFDKVWEYYCADKMLIEDRYPFIKRRLMFLDFGIKIRNNDAIENIFNYLKTKNLYNINYIKENIERTQNILSTQKPLKFKHILWLINSKFSFNKEKREHYKEKYMSLSMQDKFIEIMKKIIKE